MAGGDSVEKYPKLETKLPKPNDEKFDNYPSRSSKTSNPWKAEGKNANKYL